MKKNTFSMEKCSCKLNSSQKLAEVDMIDNNFSRKVGKNIYFEKILIFFFLMWRG